MPLFFNTADIDIDTGNADKDKPDRRHRYTIAPNYRYRPCQIPTGLLLGPMHLLSNNYGESTWDFCLTFQRCDELVRWASCSPPSWPRCWSQTRCPPPTELPPECRGNETGLRGSPARTKQSIKKLASNFAQLFWWFVVGHTKCH